MRGVCGGREGRTGENYSSCYLSTWLCYLYMTLKIRLGEGRKEERRRNCMYDPITRLWNDFFPDILAAKKTLLSSWDIRKKQHI